MGQERTLSYLNKGVFRPHAPDGTTTVAQALKSAEEVNAMAWIAPDGKKRPTLFTLLPGKIKPVEEELHKLQAKPDEETRKALEAAPPGVGIAVRVDTNDKRVRGIRLGAG